jgi:hypothetical protein
MIRKITKIAIQISPINSSVTTFIYYNNDDDDFSFTPYKNLEMAIKNLPQNSYQFPLATHEYILVTFDKLGKIYKTIHQFS